jgi:hypothetical protein
MTLLWYSDFEEYVSSESGLKNQVERLSRKDAQLFAMVRWVVRFLESEDHTFDDLRNLDANYVKPIPGKGVSLGEIRIPPIKRPRGVFRLYYTRHKRQTNTFYIVEVELKDNLGQKAKKIESAAQRAKGLWS